MYLFSVKMHIYPNLKPNLNIIDLSVYKETRIGHFNMSLQNAEQVNWESFSSLHTYYKPPLLRRDTEVYLVYKFVHISKDNSVSYYSKNIWYKFMICL